MGIRQISGHEPADPFTATLKEALPLAERPHLLNPNARRDHLFGVMKNNDRGDCPDPSLSMKLNIGRKLCYFIFKGPSHR